MIDRAVQHGEPKQVQEVLKPFQKQLPGKKPGMDEALKAFGKGF